MILIYRLKIKLIFWSQLSFVVVAFLWKSLIMNIGILILLD
jgi:hypothetical protein